MKDWAKKMEKMLAGDGDKLSTEDIYEMLNDLSSADVKVVELTKEEADELEKVFGDRDPLSIQDGTTIH